MFKRWRCLVEVVPAGVGLKICRLEDARGLAMKPWCRLRPGVNSKSLARSLVVYIWLHMACSCKIMSMPFSFSTWLSIDLIYSFAYLLNLLYFIFTVISLEMRYWWVFASGQRWGTRRRMRLTSTTKALRDPRLVTHKGFGSAAASLAIPTNAAYSTRIPCENEKETTMKKLNRWSKS